MSRSIEGLILLSDAAERITEHMRHEDGGRTASDAEGQATSVERRYLRKGHRRDGKIIAEGAIIVDT